MDNPFDSILNFPVRLSMRQKPATVSPLEPVSGLTYKMITEDIGAVIVIEKDCPIGIITEKDILDRVVTPGKDVYETLAKDVMSKPVIVIEASSMLKEALELMKKKKIRRLVVMEEGSLVGLVTERRLLAKIVNLII
ncbi:cyclic nucleotide-binding/CBS domain-containing protein [Thermoproteota archaeon]